MLSFALDFGGLAFITEVIRLSYLVSAAFSYVLGTSLSYALSVRFVFSLRRFSSRVLEYGVFLAVGIIGLCLNELFLWVLTDKVGIYYLISKIVAASLVFFWNFGARKLVLFSSTRGGKRDVKAK